MPEIVQTTIEAEVPTKEIKELLKIWNDLVKENEKLFASQAELNKVMKENAGVIAVLVKNSKNLTEADKEQLKQIRANLQAQRAVDEKRKESIKIQRDFIKEGIERGKKLIAIENERARAEQNRIKQTITLIKERQTIAQNLAKAEQQRGDEQKTREEEGIELALKNIAASQERGRALAKANQEATKAQNEQIKSLKDLIKAIGRWGFASATLFFLYRRLRREIEETIKELVGNTQEFKNLTIAAGELKRTIVLSVISMDDMIADLAEINALLTTARQLITLTSATFAGLGAVVDSLDIPSIGLLEALTQPGTAGIVATVALFKELGGELSVADTFLGAFNSTMKETVDGAIATTNEIDKFDNIIKSLVQESLRFDEAMEKNAQSLRDVQIEYQNTIIVIQNEAIQALQEIETDLADNIADINKAALKDREKAIKNFNKSVIKAQERTNKTIADNAKRHNLAMEFRQKRHTLTMLQNQRIFEFERNLLVAEGDVLAIEELDARHKLEQEAAEENFRLQMQQAEAMFKLQAKIISEAIRDQLDELRAGLAERLAEIEEGRREEIAEAEERAKELREQERKDATQRFIDAEIEKNARIRQVEDEEQKILKTNAEFLADLASDTEQDFKDVVSAWEAIYGPNAALAMLVEETYRLIEGRTAIFAADLAATINGIQLNLPTTLQGVGDGGRPRRPPSFPGRSLGFQFGGDFIASQPQLIEVGHGPERVTVQPLSAIGMMSGSMTHRWGGGAIPVQGSGNLGGADLSAIGNQIASKTVSSMRTKMRDIGRKRGT